MMKAQTRHSEPTPLPATAPLEAAGARRAGSALGSNINDSPRMVAQRAQLQGKFGPDAPIQAKFPYGGHVFTENARYATANGNREVLYVNKTATMPKPDAYFQNTGEVNLNLKTGTRPKVVKGENKFMRRAREEDGEMEDIISPIAFYTVAPKSKFGATGNTDGVLSGPNDCAAYAGALANNKAGGWSAPYAGNEAEKGLRPVNQIDPYGDDKDTKSRNPEAAVGDMFVMHWGGPKAAKPARAGYAHHAATIVAIDGGDKVTSEAHVSQKELTVPTFDIYGGDADSFYNRYEADFTYKDGDNLVGKPYADIFRK